MNYYKGIMCTIFAMEFIGASILTMLMIPSEFIYGRIVMFIYTAIILIGATVISLFYDKNTDSFRWKK